MFQKAFFSPFFFFNKKRKKKNSKETLSFPSCFRWARSFPRRGIPSESRGGVLQRAGMEKKKKEEVLVLLFLFFSRFFFSLPLFRKARRFCESSWIGNPFRGLETSSRKKKKFAPQRRRNRDLLAVFSLFSVLSPRRNGFADRAWVQAFFFSFLFFSFPFPKKRGGKTKTRERVFPQRKTIERGA